MMVHLQNKFKTLPFILEAQNNFQRFSASQKMVLFKHIFAAEFDVDVLMQVGVVKDHFMLHSSMKGDILDSWNRKKTSLLFSMLGLGDVMNHIEPILLIADYYGEKQAMYFTFLIHHIAMLMIPAIFGLLLWAYHIYLSTEHVAKDGDPDDPISNYFAILDTRANYLFLFILAFWSTIYIESWKRKQNMVMYIWASEQRIKEINRSQKREQIGATYFIEKVSGKKTKALLKETPVKNFFKTIGLIALAMIVAWCLWYLCMKQLGFWMLEIDAINDKKYKLYRLWFNIIVYSIAIIYFNRQFKVFAGKIVAAENKLYMKDHEESMIHKSYTLGFFNSYLGMGWAAFVDQMLVNVCGLLLSVLMLKQLIMNLIDLCSPARKHPKKKLAFKRRIMAHQSKEDYLGEYRTEHLQLDKEEHMNAEEQVELMGKQPPMLVAQYNELFMQLGWILFFSMTFPAGALFTIFAGVIRMKIELRGKSEY